MTDPALHFMILERDPFIAADMRAGLMFADPLCTVDLLRCVSQVMEGFAQFPVDGRSPVLITKLGIDEIEEAGLINLANRAAAQLVVREGGDTVEQISGRGWFSLASPFTSDDLSALLAQLRTPRT